MAPEVYFRNKHDITRALHACENLQGVYFHRYLEREQPHKQANDTDASDGETQPGHTLPTGSGDNDHGENDENGSYVEVIPGGNASWVTPKRQQRWFIVSTSLAYFLSLGAVAGVRLKSISTNRDYVGLTHFGGFAKYKNVVRDVEELYLDVDYNTHGPTSQNPAEA
jgi:hypothetical protein